MKSSLSQTLKKIGLLSWTVIGLTSMMLSSVQAQSLTLTPNRAPYRYYCTEQLILTVNNPTAFQTVDAKVYLNTGDLNYSLGSIRSFTSPFGAAGPTQFANDGLGGIFLEIGAQKPTSTTATGEVGRYSFSNRTGINQSTINFFLNPGNGSAVGGSTVGLTVAGTGNYYFAKAPCIDDTQAPTVQGNNLYTSGQIITLATTSTGITNTQGLEFTLIEPAGSATSYMLSGDTDYTSPTVEYVANTISADNQRGVNISGLQITIARTISGNRSRTFSGSDIGTLVFVYPQGETWRRQDKNYRVLIPASSLSGYGTENTITVFASFGDRAGIIQSGGNVKPTSNTNTFNASFNTPDNPLFIGNYPSSNQSHVRLSYRNISVRLTDRRAGINTGSLAFTINGAGYTGNGIWYSGTDLTFTGDANDVTISFTGLYDYPLATTMTITATGYDLADSPNPIASPSYTFQTRNACATYDCNEPINIRLGASSSWIELDPRYTNLIITGGNNPTYSGTWNGRSTGYIMCNLTGYTRSGTYIYSGNSINNELITFNGITNTGKELLFSGANTTRIHLSGDQATIYRMLSGYLSYAPVNGCANFVTSGTNNPVSVLLNLTGTASYATGYTPLWADLGNGTYITTLTGNSTTATHTRVINFENIYSDTGSLSTVVTCMDLINASGSIAYNPTAFNRTSGSIIGTLSGINVSTGLFDDQGIVRIYSITGSTPAPTAFNTTTSVYSGLHDVVFTGNWSGYIYFMDRALNSSGAENGNTGMVYVQVDRFDNIAPRNITGTYIVPAPGPTNQNVTLTLTGFNTGDAWTIAYTGDDEFIYAGYTGTAIVPPFLSTGGTFSLTQPIVFTENRSGTINLIDRAGNMTGRYADVRWIDKVKPFILTASYLTIGGTGTATNGYPGAGYPYAPVIPGWSRWTSGNVQLILTGNEPIQIISLASQSFPAGVSIVNNSGRTATGDTRVLVFTGNWSGYVLFDDEATNTGTTYRTGGQDYVTDFFFDIFWIDNTAPTALTGITTGTVVGVQVQNKFVNLTGNTGGDANYITDDEYIITAFSGAFQPNLSGFTITGDTYSMDKLLDFRANWSGYIIITDRAGNSTPIFIDVNGISTEVNYTIIAYSQNRGPNNYAMTGRFYVYQGGASTGLIDSGAITIGNGGTGSLSYNFSVYGEIKLVLEGFHHLRIAHHNVTITGGQTVIDFSTGDTLTGGFNNNPMPLLRTNGIAYLRAGDTVKGADEDSGRNYINSTDLEQMLTQATLGAAANLHYDLNRDGQVNSADTAIMIDNYFVEGYGYGKKLTY